MFKDQVNDFVRDKIMKEHKLTMRMLGVLRTSENGSIVGRKPTIQALSNRGLIHLREEKRDTGTRTPYGYKDAYRTWWEPTEQGKAVLRQLARYL